MRTLVACGWCDRIRLDGWVEARAALRRLRTYEWPAPPGFEHSICDDCLAQVMQRREPADVAEIAA